MAMMSSILLLADHMFMLPNTIDAGRSAASGAAEGRGRLPADDVVYVAVHPVRRPIR